MCCSDSYVLCYACIIRGPKRIFGLCIILTCISVKNSTFDIFCFLVIVKLGLGACGKFYT